MCPLSAHWLVCVSRACAARVGVTRRLQSPTFGTEAKNLAILVGGSILITLVSQFTAAEVVVHLPQRGIDQAPGTAGFGRLLLRPHPCGPLARVHGSYQSARGPVLAGWERSGGQFTYRVKVPPNALASVRVPSANPARVRDAAGGRPAEIGDYPGLLGVGEAVFQVGPGRHEFSGPDL